MCGIIKETCWFLVIQLQYKYNTTFIPQRSAHYLRPAWLAKHWRFGHTKKQLTVYVEVSIGMKLAPRRFVHRLARFTARKRPTLPPKK